MAEYGNQKTIVINREKVIKTSSSRLYVEMYQDNIFQAAQELSGVTFKIYCYLAFQKNKFRLDYSPAYISKKLNLSQDSCRKGFKELIAKNYLVSINGKDNLYNFYESTHTGQSLGEAKIIELLEKHNISYVYDTPFFEDLYGDISLLRYDFILLDDENNPRRIIEFDGPQHEKNTMNDEEAFLKIQKYDAIKNKYALSHNIPLIRIPYKEKDNITLELLFSDKYKI